jgi:DNA end-binding protein Ku
MARAIWSGVLSFGLVAVPVQLYSATEAHEPTFHQFEKGTADRIRYQRVNERTGKEVEYSDIVKGAETGAGNYVMLDQDELDSVAPGRSRSLDIDRFVDLDDIDPIYFNKTYFLAPANDETKKTYALLRDALAKTNRVAIASFVMRGKEYLAAIRADGDLLVLETMFFADEVREPHDAIDDLPGKVKLRPQELKMAEQLIDSMSGRWEPRDFRDSYTDRVNALIEAKKNDEEFEVADEAPDATNVVDLMDALRASAEAAKKGRRSSAAKRPRKAAAAKKTSGKKAAGKMAAGKKAPSKKAAAKAPAAKRAARSGKAAARKSA